MERVFAALIHGVEGTPGVALAVSFTWGILSVVLSPCHLSSIPLIVGFISGQGKLTARQAFGVSSMFAIGILVTIGLIGAITASAGRMIGDVGHWGNYLVAAVFVVVGLHLLGIIPMPWSGPGRANVKRTGFLAAFVLGLLFGVALGPCTFAFMAPILAISFKLAATSLPYAVLLLLLYGLGHCSVIVVAGTSTELVQRYLDWSEGTPALSRLKKACGVLVLAGGAYMVYATL